MKRTLLWHQLVGTRVPCWRSGRQEHKPQSRNFTCERNENRASPADHEQMRLNFSLRSCSM
jgi:hypothetical protein